MMKKTTTEYRHSLTVMTHNEACYVGVYHWHLSTQFSVDMTHRDTKQSTEQHSGRRCYHSLQCS